VNINRWGRWNGDKIEFNHALTYLSYGVRGSGKSTLLEHIGQEFLSQNLPVLDLFGSKDGEGLAFLRSPYVTEQDKKVLLLHGDNSSVASSHDSKPISQYSLGDLDRYDMIISSSPLYSSIDVEYREINKAIDEVYRRRSWTRPVYIVIREAANLLYSRLKVSKDQNMAKAGFVYFIREARHCGFSLGIDTQKLTSIDLDVRITIDYLFIKSLGIYGLPSDLKWLYATYDPRRLQNMPPEYFLLVTSRGSHGIGTFPYHKWHKEPGEDILKAVGIEVDHGDELVESKPSYQVGDLQHLEICELRLEGYTYEEIGEHQGTSKGTPWKHIRAHNEEVERLGACQRCKRAKSPICTQTITDEKPEHGDPSIPVEV